MQVSLRQSRSDSGISAGSCFLEFFLLPLTFLRGSHLGALVLYLPYLLPSGNSIHSLTASVPLLLTPLPILSSRPLPTTLGATSKWIKIQRKFILNLVSAPGPLATALFSIYTVPVHPYSTSIIPSSLYKMRCPWIIRAPSL